MRHHFLLFLAFSLFLGCSSNTFNEDIIEENQFIDVLVDIHIADAIIVVKGFKINSDSTKIRLFYNDVLMKHNVTQKQIENTFVFYSKNPRDFEKLYEKVSENIVKLEGEFEASLEIKN